jgi:hypothetical protein
MVFPPVNRILTICHKYAVEVPNRLKRVERSEDHTPLWAATRLEQPRIDPPQLKRIGWKLPPHKAQPTRFCFYTVCQLPTQKGDAFQSFASPQSHRYKPLRMSISISRPLYHWVQQQCPKGQGALLSVIDSDWYPPTGSIHCSDSGRQVAEIQHCRPRSVI